MIVLNLYEHVQRSIINELRKYLPNGVTTITDTDVNGQQPDYPYIAVNIYEPEQRVSSSPNYAVARVHIQILAIGDNKWRTLDLGHFIRHVFFLRQPLVDMKNKHVVPMTNVQPVNFTRTFLPTHFEFVDGGSFTFSVYDPITDNTQPGSIEHVNGKFDDSDFNADQTD